MENHTNVEITEEVTLTAEQIEQQKKEENLGDLFASLDELFEKLGYLKTDEQTGKTAFTPALLLDIHLYTWKYTNDFVNGHMALLTQLKNKTDEL